MQTKHFFYQKSIDIFLFLPKNIWCGYSLQAPWQGASNEYPQHVFLWRNKKTTISMLLLFAAMYKEVFLVII